MSPRFSSLCPLGLKKTQRKSWLLCVQNMPHMRKCLWYPKTSAGECTTEGCNSSRAQLTVRSRQPAFCVIICVLRMGSSQMHRLMWRTRRGGKVSFAITGPCEAMMGLPMPCASETTTINTFPHLLVVFPGSIHVCVAVSLLRRKLTGYLKQALAQLYTYNDAVMYASDIYLFVCLYTG